MTLTIIVLQLIGAVGLTVIAMQALKTLLQQPRDSDVFDEWNARSMRQADQRRLEFLAGCGHGNGLPILEGFANVEKDIWDYQTEVGLEQLGPMYECIDYVPDTVKLEAMRRMIDTAIKEPT